MKILLVNKYFYVRGGSETYFFGLAELLKKAGHEVIYFAMQDKRNLPCGQSEFFVSNVEFNGKLSVKQKLSAAMRMVYSTEAKRKFTALLEKEQPDVIHINLFHRVLTASIVDAAKEKNIPVVFTMHDLNPICPNHTMLDHGTICEACIHGDYMNCVKHCCMKDSRAKCLMAAIESSYNKKTDLYNKFEAIITPSDFYKTKLKESDLCNNPIIHLKNFLPDGTKYGVQGKRGDYVFFYGRLSEEKGILTLIRAMTTLPGVPLLIAGTGPQEEAILAEVKRLKLTDRVKLLGFVAGDNLWKLVNESACVVVPSEWYEASGYTACEAQAMGKPVVVTDAGGLPENVVDRETGLICPMNAPDKLADSIQKILSMTDEQYERMAEKAWRNAKHLFDAEQYTAKLLDIYKAVCNREGQHAAPIYKQWEHKNSLIPTGKPVGLYNNPE